MPKTWNIQNIHCWVLRNVNEQVATTRHPAAMTTMDCWWLIDRTVRNGSRWWLTISSTHKQIHHPMNDTMVLLHFSTHRSMVDTFSVAVAVLCGVWWWWWMIDFGWLIFRKKQVWDSSHSAARSIALDQEDSWRLCSRFEWDSGIDLNILDRKWRSESSGRRHDEDAHNFRVMHLETAGEHVCLVWLVSLCSPLFWMDLAMWPKILALVYSLSVIPVATFILRYCRSGSGIAAFR